MRFLSGDLPGLLAEARVRVGPFLGADPDGLAFVSNATTGINTVLQSLYFEPGDELLTDDHEYNATTNSVRSVARRDGAKVVIARIPFPIRESGEALDAFLEAVTERTRPGRARPPSCSSARTTTRASDSLRWSWAPPATC